MGITYYAFSGVELLRNSTPQDSIFDVPENNAFMFLWDESRWNEDQDIPEGKVWIYENSYSYDMNFGGVAEIKKRLINWVLGRSLESFLNLDNVNFDDLPQDSPFMQFIGSPLYPGVINTENCKKIYSDFVEYEYDFKKKAEEAGLHKSTKNFYDKLKQVFQCAKDNGAVQVW